MGQVSDRRYEAKGFWEGKIDKKDGQIVFKFLVPSEYLTDGMYFQMLGNDRPLFAAVQIEDKYYKLGKCVYEAANQNGKTQATVYSFSTQLSEWVLTATQQSSISKIELTIVILDTAKIPLSSKDE